MYRNFMFYCLFLLSPPAMAGAYMLPVSFVGLTVVQSLVAWDERTSDLNPCYGWSSCFIGPDVLYSNGFPGLYGSCVDAKNCLRIENLRTAKEVEIAWKQSFGIPWTSKPYTVSGTDASCVGLFYAQTPSRNGGNAILWPHSVCGKLPPQNQSCDVNLPTVIDFGTISQNDISRVEKTIHGSVGCTQSGTVKIYSQSTFGEGKIYFNNSKNFYSTLFLDGNSAWEGVDYNITGGVRKNISLNAKLTANEIVRAGEFSGNAIIYIAYL
ncbi:Uncharacterised protein [Serratia ficaria]|uniref:MrpH family fimbial adhesin n=1 Tax=Serratia ficaria TaxID=61651 RepID=UPI00217B14FC|nr:hypothetical protein [Serratia ficaria]CAI2043032.1 Uncharacterised protein [Serratia ficaria]CAI2434637.1 Uncharacterised protein [Serratia ficaria]